HGEISVQGSGGGSGGNIETSAPALSVSGLRVNASSDGGAAGQWLIDPVNIEIAHGAPVGAVVDPFAPIIDTSVYDGDINAALNAGTSVAIRTGHFGSPGDSDGNIIFANGVQIVRATGAATVQFELDA